MSYEAFERFLRDGPKRCPRLYGNGSISPAIELEMAQTKDAVERLAKGNLVSLKVPVEASKDFKVAASGEDSEVVEDGYHGIE